MKRDTRRFQFVAAYVIVAVGLVLLTMALFMPPVGEIHPSVIAAFGEVLTFAGASIGMDYHYRARYRFRRQAGPDGSPSDSEVSAEYGGFRALDGTDFVDHEED